MKLKLYKLMTLTSLSLCTTSLYAAHVLPEFSGAWFTSVTFNAMDACSNLTFTYTNKTQGDVALVAALLLGNVPPHDNCDWTEAAFVRDVTNGTSDFIGSDKDWKLIYADKTKPHIVVYGRSCKDKQGRIFDGKSITLQPAYVCPAGSVRSFNVDSPDGELGCTTTPAACKADVLGRDLNSAGVGDLGHIGLALPGFTAGVVMEVLTSPHEGIYTNSMQSFKNFPDSPYWGDKMGLPEKTMLTMDDASKIINAGLAQNNYPFEYTLTWDWHPGSMTSQYVLNQQTRSFDKIVAATPAKFRCDSFVYYTYLTGANLHIVPNYGIPDMPKTLFNALFGCRDHEGKYCGTATVGSLAQVFKSKTILATVLNQPQLDISLTDTTMKDYVEDASVTRLEKLSYLWHLANQYSNQENKYGYILDSLSYLHPIELIPDFINSFKISNQVANQRKLVSTIFAALKIDDLAILNNEMNNIFAAQNFMRDVLLNNRNPDILRYVLQMYPSILPADQAEQDIRTFFKRTEVVGIKDLLSAKEKALLQLRMSFVTPEHQSELIQLMENNKNDETFQQSLCFMVNNIPFESLAPNIKTPVQRYLLASKNSLAKMSDASNSACNWLAAYATVSVNDIQEKDLFMLNYIQQETDGEMRASFLLDLSKPLFKKLSGADRRHYKTELEKLNQSEVVVRNALARISGTE